MGPQREKIGTPASGTRHPLCIPSQALHMARGSERSLADVAPLWAGGQGSEHCLSPSEMGPADLALSHHPHFCVTSWELGHTPSIRNTLGHQRGTISASWAQPPKSPVVKFAIIRISKKGGTLSLALHDSVRLSFLCLIDRCPAPRRVSCGTRRAPNECIWLLRHAPKDLFSTFSCSVHVFVSERKGAVPG